MKPLADPQMRHLDVERRLAHHIEGPVRTLRTPIFLDGARDDADMSAPPALDEHGAALRASLGALVPRLSE